jgi:Chemotaxis phosphatase CheX
MTDTEQVLDTVVNEVLETMFFSAVFGPGTESGSTRMTACVSFSGSHSGALEVSALESTVTALACSFLGVMEGELPAGQAPAMLGEMANVLCGALLGRVEPEGRFRIAPPEVGTSQEPLPGAERQDGTRQVFELAEGWLAVGWGMV